MRPLGTQACFQTLAFADAFADSYPSATRYLWATQRPRDETMHVPRARHTLIYPILAYSVYGWPDISSTYEPRKMLMSNTIAEIKRQKMTRISRLRAVEQ